MGDNQLLQTIIDRQTRMEADIASILATLSEQRGARKFAIFAFSSFGAIAGSVFTLLIKALPLFHRA